MHPSKERVRVHQAPYMSKMLRKASMRRSALKNKFYKNKFQETERMYKKQNNFCSRPYKKERKKIYNNLNLKLFTDKVFWKTVKLFLSDKGNSAKKKINISEGDTIVSEDNKVAEILNNYFSESIKSLNRKENSFILNSTNHLRDPIEIASHKLNTHPSM